MRRSPLSLAVPALGLAAVLAAVVPGPVSHAAPGTGAERECRGQEATVDDHRGEILGTPGDDVIVAVGRAVIKAGAGDDVICGSDAADVIEAGAGDDVVDAGAGDDTVQGGRGTDDLLGGRGDDDLSGGRGKDDLFGGPGTNTMAGAGGVTSSLDRTVQVYMDVQSASNLSYSGQRVAFATLPGSASEPARPVVWGTLRVSAASYAGWEPGQAMYATHAEVPAGGAVDIETSVYTEPGASWAFNGLTNAFTPFGWLGNDSQMVSTSDMNATRGFGWAQAIDTGDGLSGPRPTSVTNLRQNQMLILKPGGTVWVFVTGKPAGTALESLPAGAVEISFARTPHPVVVYSQQRFTVQ